MKSSILFFLLVLFPFITVIPQENILDSYIREGIESNLALRQKYISYEQSLQDLRDAKGLFLPSLGFSGRVTVAEGGRTIDFPVGDLLNPVYSTLNMLTSSNQFPQLENQQIQFIRPFEHETKLQLIQPLFNTQIYYNKKIKSNLAEAKKADAETYRRQLVAEIKAAYYNYLKTQMLLKLVENTRKLLEENVRVNEKLFENNKITIDNIYRSKTELARLEEKKAGILQMGNSASAYFNFLLNRDLSTAIETDSATINILLPVVEEINHCDGSSREELQMVQSYAVASENNLKLNRTLKFPTLVAAVDYGFQGEKYRFTGDDDFVMASLVLKWDLFTGFQNDSKAKRAQLDLEMTDKKYLELESAITLEISNAWYALVAAGESIHAIEMQALTAQKAFEIVNKKYAQGQATLIEFIDARTSMTTAEENLIIAQYDYLIDYADYERAAGLYQFSNK